MTERQRNNCNTNEGKRTRKEDTKKDRVIITYLDMLDMKKSDNSDTIKSKDPEGTGTTKRRRIYKTVFVASSDIGKGGLKVQDRMTVNHVKYYTRLYMNACDPL